MGSPPDDEPLSDKQAQAILDMRLARLTQLEASKLDEEINQTRAKIEAYRAILADIAKVHAIITSDLTEIRDKHGDGRRTEISGALEEVEEEDLIVAEDVAVTVTHQGYVKRITLDTYNAQRRGGKGPAGCGSWSTPSATPRWGESVVPSKAQARLSPWSATLMNGPS